MILDQGGRAAAGTFYRAAPAALADWVVEGWGQRYGGLGVAGGAWRIVPDLQPHLLVHGDEGGPLHAPVFVGARSVFVDRPLRASGWTVGVALRPGALARLVRLPATELVDRSARAAELLGRPARELGRRIAGVGHPEAVLDALFGFLAAEADRTPAPPDWRVRAFLARAAADPRPRVSEIAGALGVSGRGLRQVWAREVGLSPREALSIRRLHRAVAGALRAPERTWSETALQAGYYDQPHLIRDARRLLGETPDAFLARGRGG